MQHLQILLIIEILVFLGYGSSGILEDKCLLIGSINPTSLIIVKEFPKGPAGSFSNATRIIADTNILIYSIASDPKKNVVFLAILDTIFIYHNFSIHRHISKELLTQHRSKSAALGQIAFDFVSSNLYWCDSMLNWIAMKPAYNFSITNYKVIVEKDLLQPEGLALDPEDRLMFFSDNEPNARIEKSSLDGDNRVTIVYKGLSRVLTLTVDTAGDKLYWSDFSRETLESSNYDGSERMVIRRENHVAVSGLVYYQNMVHAVSFKAKRFYAVDKTTGSLIYVKEFSSRQPFSINAYDAESQRYSYNPCSSLNCHHMCVNTQYGPKCLCSEGFQLDRDNKTCSDNSPIYKRGFLVSNASMIVMHDIHSTSGIPSKYLKTNILSNNIETFAVDAKSDTIYFVDSESTSLKKYNIITQRTSTLASISSAIDLTFDWIANLLGWIEPKQSTIQSFSVNSQIADTIYSNLQNPSSLTVDPCNGILYWVSGTSKRSIVRGSWTRDTPKVLVSAESLNNPSSLQYDVTSKRIYWLDRRTIKSSMKTGSDIKSHIGTDGATKSLVYKDYFCWINGDKLYFARFLHSKEADWKLNTIKNSKDVSVFDVSLQHNRQDSCNILNGGCREICVPEEKGRKCECDIGLQLRPDQSCDSDVLTSNFIAVMDYSHQRILQIDLKTGAVVKLPLSISISTGLAFDKSTKTLFFSSINRNIMSTSLHGKNTMLFCTIGVSYAASLAIDYSTGNLYYTVGRTESQDYIGVVQRATSIQKNLIDNLSEPRHIVLFSSKGYIFWTEMGNRTAIGRTHMDGTSKTYIVTTGIKIPNGLAIDYSSSRLYWTDLQTNTIEYSDLNGGNRRLLATDSDAFLNDIAIHGQYLYYTAWNRELITKMDKVTGSKIPFMSEHPEFGRLDSLDIFADENRDVSLSCSINNGLCSTFCFPTPNGRTCGCQDNVKLQSDQLTCEGVFRCQTLLQNLTLIDCLLPYPGLSCHFNCNAGYEPTVNTTVLCGSEGQWMPSTDTLCKEIRKTETTYTYLYVASATGAFVAVMVMIGIICLVKRQSRSRESHDGTSSNAMNNQYISYDSQGYLHPGTKNHYHSIVSVYNIIHDEDLDDESVTNPYLTPVYEA